MEGICDGRGGERERRERNGEGEGRGGGVRGGEGWRGKGSQTVTNGSNHWIFHQT